MLRAARVQQGATARRQQTQEVSQHKVDGWVDKTKL